MSVNLCPLIAKKMHYAKYRKVLLKRCVEISHLPYYFLVIADIFVNFHNIPLVFIYYFLYCIDFIILKKNLWYSACMLIQNTSYSCSYFIKYFQYLYFLLRFFYFVCLSIFSKIKSSWNFCMLWAKNNKHLLIFLKKNLHLQEFHSCSFIH